ncbi:MAG TPA: PfkB family carbohydrate kinase [Solirubrobacteraceae bacterium]|jgi:sugar/nucleoside kinase (ribokinase family)|nr:PfkB family carbohydrate kinase [Solirubrobacteraceae bacterium]
MSITVVGSIAFDSVRTPFGERERMLGGTAVHFSLASSFFADVHVVGPVGEDWGEAEMNALARPGVHTQDVERVPGGKTFFWRGHYDYDLNTAHTDDTQLGVFAEFEPKLSDASRACDVLFLANIQPELQLGVRRQCERARFVALDSMNLWIDTARDALVRVIETVDCVLLNDAELRMLTGKPNVVQAAREVLGWGPRAVVAKQGEYGAALFTAERFFSLPSFPLETVLDPTGAGDTFAGGFIGTIAAHDGEIDDEILRSAMAHGTTLASFNVEEFGTERVARLEHSEIEARVHELHEITRFSGAPLPARG